jgi:DNA-directed RNA polymerase specialized sigma24 family protein
MTPHAGQAIWLDEFTASYRDLLRFLRRRTRCDETARDLAQDAWLRMAERSTCATLPTKAISPTATPTVAATTASSAE